MPSENTHLGEPWGGGANGQESIDPSHCGSHLYQPPPYTDSPSSVPARFPGPLPLCGAYPIVGYCGTFLNKLPLPKRSAQSVTHTRVTQSHTPIVSPYRHQSPHTRLHYAHNAQEVRARAASYKAYARRVPAPWGIRDLRRSQCPSAPSLLHRPVLRA